MSDCRRFLQAYREQVDPTDRATEEAATVSGEHQRYTVHTKFGLIDLDAHCKYCARVAALEELAARREATTE